MTVKPYEILASALAALAAATAASVFGVKGTLIGAAIGAAVATTVSSLVAQSAQRAQWVLKRSVTSTGQASEAQVTKTKRPARPAPGSSLERRLRVTLIATASTLGAFLLALGLVTLIEVSAGRSFSSIFGGPASGTTVGGVLNGVSPPTTTAPTTTTTTTAPTTTTSSTTTTTTPTTTAPTTVPTTTVPGSVPSTSSSVPAHDGPGTS